SVSSRLAASAACLQKTGLAVIRPIKRMPGGSACRHCLGARVTRARGLCWRCSRKPEVRSLYPSTSKYAREGVGVRIRCVALPEPTTAPPGAEEKLAALAERARLGLALFHPDDATLTGSPASALPTAG